jgi:hypothetical protein
MDICGLRPYRIAGVLRSSRNGVGGCLSNPVGQVGRPLPLPPNGKATLVNIPAFELIAFEDGSRTARPCHCGDTDASHVTPENLRLSRQVSPDVTAGTIDGCQRRIQEPDLACWQE